MFAFDIRDQQKILKFFILFFVGLFIYLFMAGQAVRDNAVLPFWYGGLSVCVGGAGVGDVK